MSKSTHAAVHLDHGKDAAVIRFITKGTKEREFRERNVLNYFPGQFASQSALLRALCRVGADHVMLPDLSSIYVPQSRIGSGRKTPRITPMSADEPAQETAVVPAVPADVAVQARLKAIEARLAALEERVEHAGH